MQACPSATFRACTELAEVLPSPKITIQNSFIEIYHAFQNLVIMGELRQRWEQIKKLQSAPSLALAMT